MYKLITKFEAKVVGVNDNGVRILRLLNVMNDEELMSVPEWCLAEYVRFPDDVLDDEQHIKTGSILKLWKMADGDKIKIFPDYDAYPHKEKKKTEPVVNLKRMSHDSLFEDAELYDPKSLDELLQMFKARNEITPFPSSDVNQIVSLLGKGCEAELMEFLAGLLGVSEVMRLSSQESNSTEYKSSFLHCAKLVRNERAAQYQQIFQAIVSFGNSHREGKIFIGVNNKGEVVGVEKELEHETNFDNRSDFQKAFSNSLSQCVDNHAFTSSIEFRWRKTRDAHLFCEISIPAWHGKTLFLNGNELYVRDEAGKRLLKNDDIIDFILSSNGKAA